MVEITRYDCAESIEFLRDVTPDSDFETLEQAKAFSEPGWKNFKITIKIEEIEE